MDNGLFKVPVYVSEADLQDGELVKIVDKFGLEAVLTKLFGFDENEVVDSENSNFYEVTECEHRQRMHPFAIVKGKRYSGYERLDKEWINGAMASEEAKLSAKNDREYLRDLRNLGG